MADTSSRNAFLIHAAAYLGVNVVLLALNAYQTIPEGEARDWWAIYPITGWGIGIAAHGFALWMKQRSGEGHLLSDPDIRGVAIHLFVYLAVNALLIAINIVKTPESIWAVWPLLGWGAGLAAHAWLAYRSVTRKTVERYATEQEILSQMQLERQASEIAATVGQTEKKKAPATRRKPAAKKTTRKTAAGKAATKRTAAKSSSASRMRKAPAKGAAKTKTARKPATGRKKPARRSTAKKG
jgi:hypothetical protein